MKNTVTPGNEIPRKKNIKNKPTIAYQNKDIASKVFTELFPKSFSEVCGITLPEITKVHSLNLPAVSANELRIDTIFELTDGSFAIVDYESTYTELDKIKYLDYIVRILKRLKKTDHIIIRMIVLYTADIVPADTRSTLNIGSVQLLLEQSFLSCLDSEEIKNRLTRKIQSGSPLTDHELVEFVLLPLTYAGKEKKREIIRNLFDLAKNIEEEKTQIFLLAGVMVFTDKVIDQSIADQMKEWIMMTKVEKLFAKERMEAVKKTKLEVTKSVARANALAFLKDGVPVEKVARCIIDLSKEEVEALAKTIQ
ncbi:MAG: hypothetical protein PHS82_01640 [Lachnospiraceae bacterium]|nr:hypothetical protein [Lachnospiraceae bacterium]